MEVERAEDGVLHRVLVQVELHVRRRGVRHRRDAAVDVQVEAVDDLVDERDLLQEVRLADAAGGVEGEADVGLDATFCKNMSLLRPTHTIRQCRTTMQLYDGY